LALVAEITRNQRKQLPERDVKTVVSLAGLTFPVIPKIERIGDAALVRIHEQARIQVKGRNEGRICYEMLEPVEPDRGPLRLANAFARRHIPRPRKVPQPRHDSIADLHRSLDQFIKTVA
jgi:predicted RecB family nuclease